MSRPLRPAVSLLGATALALALGGCKIDNRPLLARGGPPPAAPALGPLDPTYGAAMPAGYLPPDQAYVYPQRAYAMSRTVYQRPPSYAFGYGDEQPWVWDAADHGLMFAEPIDDSWRYYYYEPGEAYPYFVQDPDYGYAYGDNGVLLALFDAAGALVAADRYSDYAPRASGYWTRAHDLNRTYWRSPRHRVEETVWRERAPAMVATRDRWFRAVAAQPAWEQALRHDNGRHLGWYKDHGPRDRGAWDRGERDRGERDRGERAHAVEDRGRQIAIAAPPAARARPEIHAERAPSRDAHAWKPARAPQPEARHPDRRQGAPGQMARRDTRGGQAVAPAAEAHARPAAWRGPAQNQDQPKADRPAAGPHGGGGHDKSGGQGGGGHDKAGGQGGGGHDKGGDQGGRHGH